MGDASDGGCASGPCAAPVAAYQWLDGGAPTGVEVAAAELYLQPWESPRLLADLLGVSCVDEVALAGDVGKRT